jgi:hypothetical protein
MPSRDTVLVTPLQDAQSTYRLKGRADLEIEDTYLTFTRLLHLHNRLAGFFDRRRRERMDASRLAFFCTTASVPLHEKREAQRCGIYTIFKLPHVAHHRLATRALCYGTAASPASKHSIHRRAIWPTITFASANQKRNLSDLQPGLSQLIVQHRVWPRESVA